MNRVSLTCRYSKLTLTWMSSASSRVKVFALLFLGWSNLWHSAKEKTSSFLFFFLVCDLYKGCGNHCLLVSFWYCEMFGEHVTNICWFSLDFFFCLREKHICFFRKKVHFVTEVMICEMDAWMYVVLALFWFWQMNSRSFEKKEEEAFHLWEGLSF